MFTTYNVAAAVAVAAALGRRSTHWAAELVRWSSALVLSAVLSARLAFGHAPFVEICRGAVPSCGPWLTLALDCALHLGPVAVLGLPRLPQSARGWAPAAGAAALFAAWFAATRGRLGELYWRGASTRVYDGLVTLAAPAGALALASVGSALARGGDPQ